MKIEVRGKEIYADDFLVAKLAPDCPFSISEDFVQILLGDFHLCEWPHCMEDN